LQFGAPLVRPSPLSIAGLVPVAEVGAKPDEEVGQYSPNPGPVTVPVNGTSETPPKLVAPQNNGATALERITNVFRLLDMLALRQSETDLECSNVNAYYIILALPGLSRKKNAVGG
jgi:hypothetical protein